MKVYIVLRVRPIGYNGCCETEIVDVFKYEEDAKDRAREGEYLIEEWYVSGA